MATLRELIIKVSANSQSFQSEIARASRMGADYYKTMERGGRQAQQANRQNQRSLAELNSQLVSVKETATGMAGALAGAFATGHLISLADQWNMVNARLKQASISTQDFTGNQASLMALSQRTGTAFTDNAGLFARSAASLREYGYTSQDALKVTEALATGLKLSGAGVQESSSVITQFSQALAQGVLRGEEFNSVNENGDRVIRALAAGMGVARKDLKAMADDGKLTADKVVPALISQLGAMQKEFEAMPATVGGSVTKVQNAFQQWVGGINEASHVSTTLSGTLDSLANNIDEVATAAGVLVTVGTARYFGGMASGAYGATAGLISAAKSEVSLAEAQLRGTQIATARARAAVYRAQQALAAAQGTDKQEAAEKRLAATQTAVTRNIAARTAAQTTLNNVTAVGSRLMSGALGLVGGVPGLLMLGAGAWYYMYQKQEQARESAIQYAGTLDDVVAKSKEMNMAQLGGAIADSGDSISSLKKRVEDLKKSQESAATELEKYNSLIRGLVGGDGGGYAIKAAEAQRNLDKATRDLDATQKLLNNTIESQKKLQDQAISKMVEMSGAVNSLADMYERLNKVTRQTTMFSHPQYAGPVLPKLDDKQQSAINKQQRERILSGLKDIERARKQAGFEADDLNLTGGWRQKYLSDAEAKFRNDEANKPKKKEAKTDEEKAVDAYERLVKQQREQLALDSQSTEFAKIKYQTLQGEYSTLNDLQKTELLRNATALDYLKTQEKFKDLQKELLTPEEEILAKTRERIALLKQAAPATEQYRDSMERISKATITQAPKFGGIDASVGGPSGELIKVAEAQKELETWHKKQIEMQKKLLDEKEINEQTHADRIAEINSTNTSRMEDIQNSYALASLGVFSDLTGQTAQMLQGMGKEGSAAYRTLFLASKAAAIAQTLISTEVSAMKAMELGPIFGIPASTAIRGMGYASVALIAGQTIAGMAHDGIDRVPETGTWLLQKGERVVTAQTSAKLDSTLERVHERQRERDGLIASMGDINVSYSFTGKPDDSVMVAIDQKGKALARQIKAELTQDIIKPQTNFGNALKTYFPRTRKS